MKFVSGIQSALEHGKSQRGYMANHFECITTKAGRFLFHYRQGMLVNVWHVDTGNIWTVPAVVPQLMGKHERDSRLFKKAVAYLQREGPTWPS